MNSYAIRSSSKCLMISLGLVAASSALAGSALGQNVPEVHVKGVAISGVPDDWTHHHVLFSNPGTEQEASQQNRHERWQKVVNDPRYVIQEVKKESMVQGPAATDAAYRAQWVASFSGKRVSSPRTEEPDLFGFELRNSRRTPHPTRKDERDWSMTSGGVGGLAAGHYPAKYQFGPGPTNVEGCTDYVAFPTGIQGSATQATLVAYNNLYKTTCSGSVPGILLSVNTGGLANTSPVLSLDGTQVAYIQTPILAVTGTVRFLSTQFTLTTPVLTSSLVGAAITGANIPAGTTIASVTNSTTGTLSQVPSSRGTNEAITITGFAQLVLLKIGAGGGSSVTSPIAPTPVTNASYRACTGPCYTTLTLNGNTTDGNSAPFYVYADTTHGSPDLLYVGDDSGNVHKFTNVFLSGTPAETTTKWPVSVTGTETLTALNSPVYDSTSGYMFVGDESGYLHQFSPGTTTPGTVSTSGHLAYETGGLADSPIVDTTSGTTSIYQFVGYSDDTANNRPSYINVFTATGTNSIAEGAGNAQLYGTTVYFPNGSTSTRPASTSTVMYAGTLDNAYYTGSPTNPGNIYACADGVLYQIPVSTITTPKVYRYSTATSAPSNCSPVTEFHNSTDGNDYLFMSVAGSATASGGSSCTGACVLNYVAPTNTTTNAGTPAAGLPAAGGTSGIVIDNSATGGGSEIYFTSLGSESCAGNGSTGSGTGSCAVQATQSGLQ